MSIKDPTHQNYGFDAAEYLENLQQDTARNLRRDSNFTKACEAFSTYLDEVFERDQEVYRERQYQAIIGEPSAKNHFIEHVREFLRTHMEYQATSYPEYYKSLSEALFNHVIGFGPMSVWLEHPTESAHVNGINIFFSQPGTNRMVKQPFQYDSIEHVERLIRAITLRDPTAGVSTVKNITEVEMLDGTRVTIFVPPMSYEPFIAFRQYTFREFSFEKEAEKQTIPSDSVEWFKLLAKSMVNIMATGFRRSGKTSLLEVFYAERDPSLTVVSLESRHFEVRLKQNFPGRDVVMLKAQPDELNTIFEHILRADAHFVFVPEVRMHEVELLIHAAERGNGYLASYHGQHMLKLPAQLARLSLQSHPERGFESEHEAAASLLDVVIHMTEDETGRRLVLGVYAFDYDDEHSVIRVTPWMVHDKESDAWTFQYNIPERLKRVMLRTSPKLFSEFDSELERLAREHPYQGPSQYTTQVRG